MSTKRDYYDVLGVPRDVDASALKKAFRKLAIQFHPDRNDAPEAEERFKELNEAYAVLSDPEKRAAYDQFGHEGLRGGGNPFAGRGFQADLRDVFGGDMFEQLFGSFFGQRPTQPGARHGRDVRLSLEVTLEEVAQGARKAVSFRREASCERCSGTGGHPDHPPTSCGTCGGMGRVRVGSGFLQMVQPCPHCRGQGQSISVRCPACAGRGAVEEEVSLTIPVPAGIDAGQTMRLDGEGGRGYRGGLPGDLYVDVEITPHPFLQRDGDDLVAEVPISFPQAALGASVTVPTLDGKARMKVPAGTQSGKVMRLRGKGLPDVHGRGRGDQLVRLQIETPTVLTARQKELLEEFEAIAAEQSGDGEPKRRSFLDTLKELFD